MSAHNRRPLSISEKIGIIAAAEKNESQWSIASRLHVPVNDVQIVVQARQDIMTEVAGVVDTLHRHANILLNNSNGARASGAGSNP